MTRVSVVMSVYNGAEHLAPTIDSILAQTERDLELVVTDDGSTDATPEILRDYAARDSRVRVIAQKNTGLTRALIAGCAAARAPLIARHDAGDLSHPERIAKQAALFDQWPERLSRPHGSISWGPRSEYLHSSRDARDAHARAFRLTKHPPLIDGPSHPGTVLFRREVYARVGELSRPRSITARTGTSGIASPKWGSSRACRSRSHRKKCSRRASPLLPASSRSGSRDSRWLHYWQDNAANLRRHRGRGRDDRPSPAANDGVAGEAAGLYFIGEGTAEKSRRLFTSLSPQGGCSLAVLRACLDSAAAVADTLETMNWLRALNRKLGIKYRVDRCVNYVRRFGVRRAMSTYRQLWSHGGALQEVHIPRVPHPVTVRAGTADASTLEKMFVWNDYDLDYPADVKTVIDAGANIGLSAVFFANRFPDATIVAIEPEEQNFALLRRNTAPYPRIVPLHAALWSEDTTLRLSNPDDRVDSYRFDPATEGPAVPAFSIPSILSRFGLTSADVLKIDIEGGETAVFAASAGWIDRVRMFVVELHGDEATAAFTAATSRLHAKRYRRGENEIVVVDEKP
jgi:FkbM family methyltransferase